MATFLDHFRSPYLRASVITLGVTIKTAQWAEFAHAQQSQRVNVAEVNGQTPVPAVCDNSTEVNSSAFLIAGTGATNSVILTISLVSGDSTNCSSNSTITTWVFSSYSGITKANGGSPQYKPISSNSAVCIKTGSSGPVYGSLTYVRRGD